MQWNADFKLMNTHLPWIKVCILLFLLLFFACEVFALGITTRASKSTAGVQGNHTSNYPSISASGQYVAFMSLADTLVDGDTNGAFDVFVHDLQTGVTSRVSVSSAGVQANGDNGIPAISPDGRYVAFDSGADNLVDGDPNGAPGMFVHDLQTGETSRVNVSGGTPAISSGGRYVAFVSSADDLVTGDTNGVSDVFVHDRQTGETSRVSVSSAGAQGNNISYGPAISPDGRYVAFDSHANTLVDGDTNGDQDVFVHDLQTGVTLMVSVSSAGVQGNNGSGSSSAAISSDGRYVAFESWADNLVDGDTNGAWDVFVHDLQTGVTSRVSVSSEGEQGNGGSSMSSFSFYGRYVAFHSEADNLVVGDTNDESDIFVHDRLTGETSRVSVSSEGVQSNDDSYVPSISSDGRYIAFESEATNLITGDTNGHRDIFVHDRQTGEASMPWLLLLLLNL